MSDSAVIQFHKVTKYFRRSNPQFFGLKDLILHMPRHGKRLLSAKRLCALNDVSFEILKGESVGLIGPNGSGKSTALSIIANVLRPSSGRVETSGRICSLLELGAGFHHLLNGAENIFLSGVLLGMTRREVKARFAEIVEFSGLEDFLEQPVRTYSSGMLARLGFSVAAHLDPQILLLDEVLSVGDIAFTERCLKKMNAFRERGVTIVFVSHDLAATASFCDRAIWINSGRIQRVGAAKTICEEYRKAMVG